MSHRFLDHTADVGVDLQAPTLAVLYAAAAVAFTDTVTPWAGVNRTERRVVAVAPSRAAALDRGATPDLADDEVARRDAMVAWLEELLFLFETEGFLVAAAEVRLVPRGLTADLHGETYDPDRHPVKVLVKAVTYHALEVTPTDDGWHARVIFDI